MSAIAVLLIAIGITDLLRPAMRRQWVPALIAPAFVITSAALCGLWHPGDRWPIGIAAVAAAGWELSAGAAEHWRGVRQAAPLLVFPGALIPLFLLSGLASPVAGAAKTWVDWAASIATVSPDRLMLIIGVLLVQLATGNQVVRLLLTSIGAVKPTGQPQPSDRLRGGRLLGPMERTLILGLGLAGQLSVATAVIAAKSIIRFPEINAQKSQDGGISIDDVTEYFLIGSFASWIIALGGLSLTQLR